MEIIFWCGTTCLALAQMYVYQVLGLVWHKKFGPAQNSFRPVEGRGMSTVLIAFHFGSKVKLN
jgi:hypothetical protein